MARYIPFLDKGTRRRSILLQATIFLAFLIALGLIVFGVAFTYVKEGNRSRENAAIYNIQVDSDALPVGENDLDLYIDANIADVNPATNAIKITSRIIRLSEVSRTKNATLLLGSLKAVPFSATTLYADQDSTVWADGDSNRYPFDSYSAEAAFAVATGDIFDAVGKNATNGLKSGIIVYAALQNWRFDMELVPAEGTQLVMLHMKVYRAPTTIGFSMFILVLMWMITLAIVCITFHHLLRAREVVPPLIAIYVALLFALPAVRNVQPNIPPIGTLTDTIGLFWHMVIVAICGIIMMFRWIGQAPAPTPPAATEQKSA